MSYDAREVTQKVLEELPDIPLLDAQEMQVDGCGVGKNGGGGGRVGGEDGV